ncbi:hypothetical protein AAFF_G00122470 [Aldrovandia affinis]|uniref:Uncharacterized protein n=1 Tax=Aldrovandia affinis TaxID=143900 RepID=A0AAD7RS48_9TELE|nr:hypothetical protein AAFF_G00122470 [Aldrovandia affinis]
MVIFRAYCKNKITEKKIRPEHITNMDEIPLTFDIPVNRTVEKTGTRTSHKLYLAPLRHLCHRMTICPKHHLRHLVPWNGPPHAVRHMLYHGTKCPQTSCLP